MKKVLKYLKGKKTYIVAALMVVYALLGYYLGELEHASTVNLCLEGLAIAGLRAGVSKIKK